MWKRKQNFCLNVFFDPAEKSPYMKVHERYSYKDLENIFEETDILVAPSMWYETFGYTVLEALSYGVPVLISGTVGAKDILADGAGIVIEQMTEEKLLYEIEHLTVEKLQTMNEAICSKQKIMSLAEMANLMSTELYRSS